MQIYWARVIEVITLAYPLKYEPIDMLVFSRKYTGQTWNFLRLTLCQVLTAETAPTD